MTTHAYCHDQKVVCKCRVEVVRGVVVVVRGVVGSSKEALQIYACTLQRTSYNCVTAVVVAVVVQPEQATRTQ
jgi:hypothetical protein